MSKKILRNLLYIVLPTTITVADQIIKNLFYANSEINKGVLLFSFYLTKNFGIIAGIPFNLSEIVVIFIMVILLITILKNKFYDLLVYFFIAILGVFSNLVDKIRFGFVIDYINIFSFSHFNIADLLIYIGCILMIWKLFKKPINQIK